MPNRVRKPVVFPLAEVLDFQAAAGRRRLEQHREQIAALLAVHRRALTVLCETGLMFTRHGTRAGRELLAAQQGLLKARDLIARDAKREGCAGRELAAKLLLEIESLLEKSASIARRHRSLFDGR